MRALLDAAQPERVGVLVADDQAHHLGVEIAARGEIARGEHEVARAGDVERRIEIGFWNVQLGGSSVTSSPARRSLRTIAPHCVELAVDHRAVLLRRDRCRDRRTR